MGPQHRPHTLILSRHRKSPKPVRNTSHLSLFFPPYYHSSPNIAQAPSTAPTSGNPPFQTPHPPSSSSSSPSLPFRPRPRNSRSLPDGDFKKDGRGTTASPVKKAARPKSSPRRCSSVRTSDQLRNRKLELATRGRIVDGSGMRMLLLLLLLLGGLRVEEGRERVNKEPDMCICEEWILGMEGRWEGAYRRGRRQ